MSRWRIRRVPRLCPVPPSRVRRRRAPGWRPNFLACLPPMVVCCSPLRPGEALCGAATLVEQLAAVRGHAVERSLVDGVTAEQVAGAAGEGDAVFLISDEHGVVVKRGATSGDAAQLSADVRKLLSDVLRATVPLPAPAPVSLSRIPAAKVNSSQPVLPRVVCIVPRKLTLAEEVVPHAEAIALPRACAGSLH